MTNGYAASEARPDYDHRYHAGNVGDVWKHVVWWALLERLQRNNPALDLVDCHAGAGEYRLHPTGEWTAGIGALRARGMSADSAVVAHYRAFIEEFGAHDSKLRRYPGSPRLLERLRRPSDRVSCYELEPTPFSQLTSAPFDGAIERVHGDGLAALRARCAEPTSGGLVGLIDPPWNVKADWRTIPGAVIDCLKATPTAVIAVWYPIKSYTRVNQMIRTIREAGLPYLVGDLITTPLELQRNRLNGSGIIVINPPSDLAPTLAAAAAVIGAACASHHGFFELRLTASALAAEAAPAALTAGEHRANGENAIA